MYSSTRTSLSWQVSTDSQKWSVGNNVIISSSAAKKFVAKENGNTDIFMAGAKGIWSAYYYAQHNGTFEGWAGTAEKVALKGKNKLIDMYEGSNDANILIMTDDANGDALFIDDVYNALPGDVSVRQARIANIDEIRAGAGDDIIDMTSSKFEYVGHGVKISGGSGNDVIWANNGENLIFGDAGNDRIIGGGDNDMIIGGSGNDTMHGGGGDDIFFFGGNWGEDTVEQLADGKVTLYFESGSEDNWNAETMTYSDGINTVTVSGISNSDVTLKFGADISLPDGVFADSISENIFEDKNKGMIA